ncbi:YncE family protein [Kibdelosporangium phytohabitans]|uniref:Surface layer protein n=1 Tax=Kibdelosporangium phytohabitans TaxID=860235 RepID=A0A0N9HX82_9PSEU|nr:hypothetical protein [Kibdelosporangium phytohabitans]ALG09907.1 hypothetical protein AOZ06_26095 [Kibdelosporangium phytohabitans]MBE1468689.1 DNA-binding beta-propeller fold protein YncE [Kibdelosporangium phytohabitans]
MTTSSRGDGILAVANQGGHTVAFFETGGYRCRTVVDVPAEPHELCFDHTRRLLYCSHTYRSGYYNNYTERAHEISVIDPDGGQVVDIIDLAPEFAPHGLALDAGRELLYASVEANDTTQGGLVVIDTGTRRPVDRITTGAHGPHWFGTTPDADKAYVANMEAPFVSVVDLPSREWVGKVEVTGSAGVGMAPDGRYAYVATPHPHTRSAELEKAIQVIETATDRIVRTIPMQHKVVGVHATATGMILATEVRFGEHGPADGWLNVFSPRTFESLARIGIGKQALSVTSSPDGTVGYVSSLASNVVDVVDLIALAPIARISTQHHGGDGPHGMVHIPAG